MLDFFKKKEIAKEKKIADVVRDIIPKKLQRMYDYAAEEDGEIVVFLNSEYRCTINNDCFFYVKKDNLKEIKEIFLYKCYYDGCRKCAAKATSRCNKKCRHFYENRK